LLLTAAPAHGKGAGFNSHCSIEARPLAIPELGAKQVCPNCQAKFYDLNKRPAHCPKCATEFDPDEAVRSRRVRARAAPVDHELDDEREDQVRGKKEDAEDEEEEEEVVTPALDEAVDEPVLISDDDDEDGEPVAAPEDELAGFAEEEDLEDEDDADVPFLEEDEDDDFDDTEIDGLPGEGDEEDR
jgi:uncharacterized protein (TIGR02300 family)